MVTKKDFENLIRSKINRMTGDYIDLTSGDIHRELGGYPAKNGDHRMPTCCDTMCDLMAGNDEIISPTVGKGAYLTIRYYKKNHCQTGK